MIHISFMNLRSTDSLMQCIQYGQVGFGKEACQILVYSPEAEENGGMMFLT